MISPSLMSGIDGGAHMIALADAIGFDVGVSATTNSISAPKSCGGGYRSPA